MRTILEAPQDASAASITASGEGQDSIEIDPVMQAMLGGGGGVSVSKPTRSGDTSLIADLTEKLDRAPQKRLEQMVDFDEEQAAAILKQWLREAEPA